MNSATRKRSTGQRRATSHSAAKNSRPWTMWLRLYQSASIWLVFGLSRSADPQLDRRRRCRSGCGPSRAGSRRRPRESARRGVAARRRHHRRRSLAERCTLQRSAIRRDAARHAARLRTRLRRKPRSRRRPSKIPDTATWIDLEEPTKEEEALVERCIRLNVPTESEMAEIEPSSRLYERDGALYMTVSVLFGLQDGEPRTTPDQLRSDRQPAGDGALRDPEAGARLRRPCPARSALVERCADRAGADARCDHRPACRRARGRRREIEEISGTSSTARWMSGESRPTG